MAKNGQTNIASLREELREAAQAEVTKVSAELDKHTKSMEKLYARRDQINDQINELKDRRAEIGRQIETEDMPKRHELSASLSAAARDAGGRFLSDPS